MNTAQPPFVPVQALPSPLALSVVVPCYNQESGLAELLSRAAAACRSAVGDSFEIILVDDGSGDKTWPSIAALPPPAQHLAGVKLSRNHAHQAALIAGL